MSRERISDGETFDRLAETLGFLNQERMVDGGRGCVSKNNTMAQGHFGPHPEKPSVSAEIVFKPPLLL
jgi:hypothetical protein